MPSEVGRSHLGRSFDCFPVRRGRFPLHPGVGNNRVGNHGPHARFVPLCHEHESHWTWRLGYIYTGTGFFAVVGLTALLYVVLQAGKEEAKDLIGFLCVLPAGIGIAWLISAAIVQNGSVRATEITSRRITLCRVSPAFVEAIEAADDREEDEYYRHRRKGTRGDEEGIYDPETRGKYRRLPRDTFREDHP